ncbi:MAG: SRPBCC family protein [Elusimicrobiota bacterium]|jgi:ribosome-associated toxin RatA of RatAB toxin-antitoxin module
MLLEDAIEIDCPPAPLFKLISDVEHHVNLLPGYLESSIVERRADTFVLQREAIIHGRVRRWKSEVSLEEGCSIHFRQLEGPLEGMRVHWDMEPKGQATKLRIVHDVRVKPWWKKWWLERWIAKPAIEKTARAVLEAIKRAAEMREKQ